MAIQTRETALKRALESETNKVGMCQQWTRELYDAPSVGDVDGDGDADAADGWFSEPPNARHLNDRNPPLGVPLYFLKNGGKGNGHRAISTGNGSGVRSIDMSDTGGRYQAGNVGTATIEQIEKAMGLTYVGWSSTIDRFAIPEEPKPVPKKSRGPHVDAALVQIRKAKKTGEDARHLEDAKKSLLKIKLKLG